MMNPHSDAIGSHPSDATLASLLCFMKKYVPSKAVVMDMANADGSNRRRRPALSTIIDDTKTGIIKSMITF